MRRIILSLLLFLGFILVSGRFIVAFEPNATGSATVKATVLDPSEGPPILNLPASGSAISTARPTFSWSRPNPQPVYPLHHYDLYIDGSTFAGGISDSLTFQDYYFYTATASAGTFYITMKTDMTQGNHTWKVVAFNIAGSSASSETRTLYIDSIPPYIGITKVDTTTLSWITTDPTTIPSSQRRHLTITTTSPIIKGTVEQNSNIKYVLICPQNISNCSGQTFQENNTTGNWSHTFTGIIAGITYTVQVSATDAAGNSTFFPDFYITYPTTTIPTSTATISPTTHPTTTVTPSPGISPTASPSGRPTLPPFPTGEITPPPGLLVTITPTVYISSPPPSPTIPPVKPQRSTTQTVFLFYSFLIILMVIGLPLHLLMASVSLSIPILSIPRFLLILCFPFFTNKKYQSTPFTAINIFISDKLDHPWQKVITDINGFYGLKSSIPESTYIELFCANRNWKGTLLKGNLFPTTCLYPLIKTSLNTQEKVLKTVYDLRSIPLALACLTSITAFFIQPSYYILIYIYFSLQYTFSEYVYPRFTQAK